MPKKQFFNEKSSFAASCKVLLFFEMRKNDCALVYVVCLKYLWQNLVLGGDWASEETGFSLYPPLFLNFESFKFITMQNN